MGEPLARLNKSPLSEELRKLDLTEWRREALKITWGTAATVGFLVFPLAIPATVRTGQFVTFCVSVAAISFAVHLLKSYRLSIKRRFQSPKLLFAWKTCEDRLARFRVAVKKLRKAQIADFEQMPLTIERVAEGLYLGLRRADILLREVTESEGAVFAHMAAAPPIPRQATDQVASQLYQIADRNAAEYRQRLNGILAGVERTEAQAAVFASTLDTLRMKMLGHRMTGASPNPTNSEFLSALGEAKLQLEAIDKALDELEINPFGPAPQTPIAPNNESAAETVRAEQEMDEQRLHESP